MIDSGMFQVKTAGDLFAKLLKDYDRIKKARTDSEAWFNFIVTADQLPEWELLANEDAAKVLRGQHALLRVRHYLAVNAKHFRTRKPNPGISTAASSMSFINFGNDRSPERRPPPQADEEFFLLLSGKDTEDLGPEVPAMELARLLVKFWQERIAKLPTPPLPTLRLG